MEITKETIRNILVGDDYTPEQKSAALKWLIGETNKNNPDALYMLATLIDIGAVSVSVKNVSNGNQVLWLMHQASARGNLQARAYVNAYCKNRYESRIKKSITPPKNANGLIGFDNKPIKINRRGILTPVDAVLENKDGQNVLTLSVPINFVNTEIKDETLYKKAVIDGIMDWQGDYEVFGGQKLRVVVEVTEVERVFDTVYVMALTKNSKEEIKQVMDKLHVSKKSDGYRTLVKSGRSFATLGFRWKTTSRKMIYMQSENLRFDDYEELRAVARHEFGHVLGLGDLYKSRPDDLLGVNVGSYQELDCYYIDNMVYNLVMCDHHAEVTNNDIEMVVLAFSKNKMQLFQRFGRNSNISDALGIGN